MGEETVGEKKTKKTWNWALEKDRKRENAIKNENERFREQTSKLQVGSCSRDPPNRRHGKTNVFSNPGSLTGSPQPYRKVDRSFGFFAFFFLLLCSSWLKHATGGNRFWFPSINALCFFLLLFPL
jgi:hypothetical protein